MTERASNTVDRKTPSGQSGRQVGEPGGDDDLALVNRSRKGDMDAFGQLVSKYQDRLYNLILRMCGRAADAEELTQETFLKALESLDQFRGESRFYTWLFRIAANKTISYKRRGSRIKFQQLVETGGDGAESGRPQNRSEAPESSAMRNENQTIILEALESLDEQLRLVTVLREIEDLDYMEISRILEIPAGTVRSRLHRARIELKDKLGKLVE